jgi:hypothetical protein
MRRLKIMSDDVPRACGNEFDENDYEAYVKGKLEMGGFVNLMERVECMGKEIVYR